MTITNTLVNKFGVKNVEEIMTLDGFTYFEAVDTDFGDIVEIKVNGNGDVYTRIQIEGIDIDFEMDGVTDIYIHRGSISTSFLTAEEVNAVEVIQTEYKGIDLNAMDRNIAKAAKYYMSTGDSLEVAVQRAQDYINYYGHTFRVYQ